MIRYKLKYLSLSAVKYVLRRNLSCPSCGSSASSLEDRKWLVTALRRCDQCRLLFRAPTTSAAESRAYYDTDYEEGFTTQIPPEHEVQRLVRSKFAGHEKSYAEYIRVLHALGASPGQRLFDYGCSWGYGSYQLREAGFVVDSFEISRRRSAFGQRTLGVNAVDPAHAPAGAYDVFFSAHVIEHVPSVAEMIQLARRLLKPGGLFVAFTPNGSSKYREQQPYSWHKSWGSDHPQLLDERFAESAFGDDPLILTSSPHAAEYLDGWRRSGKRVGDLSGAELMVAAACR